MVERTPIEAKNLVLAGNLLHGTDPGVLDWTPIRDQLAGGAVDTEYACFLGTVRPDGRPHAAGVGLFWFDGDLYFVSSPQARKARNLANNPNCTLAIHLQGYDLTLEGTAEPIFERAVLESLVKVCNDGGWPARIEGDGFNAPFMAQSGGPPPWHLYRFVWHTAIALATGGEDGGATRWRF